MDMVVLPLLVQLPHVHQTILHLLQTPDLLPTTPTSHLNCWFTEHCVPLKNTRRQHVFREFTVLKAGCACERASTCLCGGETLRLALRLSDGICRVTLYSVCRSSSSAIKQASCTRRFALTICSLNRRRLLTNTTSLMEDGRKREGNRGEKTGIERRCFVCIHIQMDLQQIGIPTCPHSTASVCSERCLNNSSLPY